MKRVWCVAWRHAIGPRGGAIEWCATFRNAKPSTDAVHDKTACGMVVTLRVGSGKRLPTCVDCLARLARRGS